RDETNLPRFMESLEHVEKLSDRSSRWTVLGPAGRRLHWVSTITEDRPSEFIAWRAEENADIRNAGWVEFRDLGSGTSTRVETFMAYEPPIGLAGHAIASLLGRDPASAIRRSLPRLKQGVESEMEQENKQPTGAEQYRSAMRAEAGRPLPIPLAVWTHCDQGPPILSPPGIVLPKGSDLEPIPGRRVLSRGISARELGMRVCQAHLITKLA